jgi:hypothetical protein
MTRMISSKWVIGVLIICLLVPPCASIAIKTYPLQFINGTRILPNSDIPLPPEGTGISINITPGDFEASSFVIKAPSDLTDITITGTALSDGIGNTIPVSATDIKVVGVWNQATPTANEYGELLPPHIYWYQDPNTQLTPELLLNNKSTINVPDVNQSQVWVINDSFEGYVNVDLTSIDQWQADYKVFDNSTAGGFPQPFSLNTNNNQQIWITTHAPTNAVAGNYTGKIWINSSGTSPLALNISIRVLPFSLREPTKIYGLYYDGQIRGNTNEDLQNKYKTNVQYSTELTNMKNHGIRYPTFSQPPASAYLSTAFQLRNLSGLILPTIYQYGSPYDLYSYPDPLRGFILQDYSSSAPDLAEITRLSSAYKSNGSAYGYTDIYIYGSDEISISDAIAMRPQYGTVRNNNMKVWIAGDIPNYYSAVGDLINQFNTPPEYGTDVPNQTQAALWHSYGDKITLYANPQAGVENFSLYRANYGYRLWITNFDGGFTFDYQGVVNDVAGWNDLDGGTYSGGYHYKDHMFTYIKTDGVIDTIQWEGMREGIDDSRYADTLSNITGNTTEALTIINNGISNGQDMSTIRNTLIDHILAYENNAAPTPTPTQTVTPIPGHPGTPPSGITPITQALSILGVILVLGGIMGIVYSLAGISGMVGRGGSSFSVNTTVLVASIIVILVGAIFLFITYAILSPLAALAGL